MKYHLWWECENSGVSDTIGYYSTLKEGKAAMCVAIKENQHIKYHLTGGKKELHYDPNDD
jgi:hypothetical protein